MPFTFSHPAIVLPLKKMKPAWFSTTGLAVGSMAPDFPYFLKMDGESDFGHTFTGIFLLDLPFCFLIAIAFHRWFRNSLIRHLPSPLDQQYAACLSFRFLHFLKRGWLLFAVSSFIGVVSHLLWDDFAQPDGYLYYVAPSFFSQPVRLGPFNPPLYQLLEWAGAALGLAFVGWVVLRKRQEATPFIPLPVKQKVSYWLSIALGTAAVASAKLVADKDGTSFGHYVIVLISAGLFAFAWATPLFGFLHKPQKRDSKGPPNNNLPE
jgi:hypothetical protein